MTDRPDHGQKGRGIVVAVEGFALAAVLFAHVAAVGVLGLGAGAGPLQAGGPCGGRCRLAELVGAAHPVELGQEPVVGCDGRGGEAVGEGQAGAVVAVVVGPEVVDQAGQLGFDQVVETAAGDQVAHAGGAAVVREQLIVLLDVIEVAPERGAVAAVDGAGAPTGSGRRGRGRWWAGSRPTAARCG